MQLLAPALVGLLATEIATAQFQTQSSPAPLGNFGASVAGIGDVDFDGVPDYAVGGTTLALPGSGNGAGAVLAYSGATGAALWGASGSGGWIPCGGSGTTGDNFGAAIVRIPDVNGDGLDDLAVGAPNFSVGSGSCRVAGYGRLYILDATTGLTILEITESTASLAPRDFFGARIKRGTDTNFDDIDEFVVMSARRAYVFDGSSPSSFLTVTLNVGEAVATTAGDVDGNGFATEIAIGNPTSNQVRIVDLNFPTTTTISGPASSFFGAELEYAPAVGPTGAEGVLIGAPQQGSGAGAVHFLPTGGTVGVISTGSLGDGLGNAIAFGGNADADGLADDALVGARSGNYVRLLDLGGTTIRDVAQPGGSAFGASVAWIGQIVPNSFDEFVVGDPGTAAGGQADAFYGGPSASVDQAFGPGFHPTGGAVPMLTQSAALVPGASMTASVAAPGAIARPVVLYWGLSSTTGVPFGGGTIWMDPSFGPFLRASGATNAAGNWTSLPLSLPLDPNLVGLSIAHQAGVGLPGGAVALSNATESVIGW
ncbi:MAG: integrin alpha [Planctomycetota bacterium]